MNTHTTTGGNRRLALITLYASLCSILTLVLAVQWSNSASALSASASSTTEVSALTGTHGITAEDLKAFQRTVDPIATRRALRLHGAGPAIHQLRSR